METKVDKICGGIVEMVGVLDAVRLDYLVWSYSFSGSNRWRGKRRTTKQAPIKR